MEKKINKRIFEIAQILQGQELLKSIGVSLNNSGVTSKRFYESMKESEVGLTGAFGNNTFNSIQNKESNINKALSLEEIVKLVNELDGLMRGVNSIKLNLDKPLKKG